MASVTNWKGCEPYKAHPPPARFWFPTSVSPVSAVPLLRACARVRGSFPLPNFQFSAGCSLIFHHADLGLDRARCPRRRPNAAVRRGRPLTQLASVGRAGQLTWKKAFFLFLPSFLLSFPHHRVVVGLEGEEAGSSIICSGHCGAACSFVTATSAGKS